MDPNLKMYFLLNMGIVQPAMLVYQKLDDAWWYFSPKGKNDGDFLEFSDRQGSILYIQDSYLP